MTSSPAPRPQQATPPASEVDARTPVAPGDGTATLAPWRVTYQPGEWIVLAGPSAVVMLQPAPEASGAVVTRAWELVLAARGASDLVARLAGIGLDAMPNLAVVFRDDAGLHALLRGDTAVDDAEGQRIADGSGVRTWREADLDAERVHLVHGASASERSLAGLPLLVGAARADRVLVDLSHDAVPPVAQDTWSSSDAAIVASPAADSTADQAADDADGGAADDADDHLEQTEAIQQEDTEAIALDDAVTGDEVPPAVEPVAVEPVVVQSPAVEPGPDADAADGGAAGNEPVALGELRANTGDSVLVRGQVVIGRAPAVERFDDDAVALRVPSPGHDISRTHALVLPDGDRLHVVDLHSTNGTILATGDGEPFELDPGVPTPLPIGSVIDLGDGITIEVLPA